MNTTSKQLSIVAFYLSEYNYDGLKALGYRTYSEAFQEISSIFHRANNYLKLRRDEFDALPESHSSRVGWQNRPASKRVIATASYLRQFDFETITALVRELISNARAPFQETIQNETVPTISPSNIESIINATDTSAQIKVKVSETKIRIYSVNIIHQLKALYGYRCQICGCCIGAQYNSHLIHAHHIDYFSRSLNNTASNILIVCPNHHGIIHDMNPIFDRVKLTYQYPNGYTEGLKYNLHL